EYKKNKESQRPYHFALHLECSTCAWLLIMSFIATERESKIFAPLHQKLFVACDINIDDGRPSVSYGVLDPGASRNEAFCCVGQN
ncbi:hypothetical protein, partial [Escherichia coli]|uniref:hypothetical protein n=1 Tax=Escherichia coli TaxID=562 RepID=UPI001BECF171